MAECHRTHLGSRQAQGGGARWSVGSLRACREGLWGLCLSALRASIRSRKCCLSMHWAVGFTREHTKPLIGYRGAHRVFSGLLGIVGRFVVPEAADPALQAACLRCNRLGPSIGYRALHRVFVSGWVSWGRLLLPRTGASTAPVPCRPAPPEGLQTRAHKTAHRVSR